MSVLTTVWIAWLATRAPIPAAAWGCGPAFDDAPALEAPRLYECSVPGRRALRARLVQPPCSLAWQLEASAADAEPIGPIR